MYSTDKKTEEVDTFKRKLKIAQETNLNNLLRDLMMLWEINIHS